MGRIAINYNEMKGESFLQGIDYMGGKRFLFGSEKEQKMTERNKQVEDRERLREKVALPYESA